MKDCTYYDLLGIPLDATDDEITDAKNFLVKKFHPDANLNCEFDTTPYMQNVLNAYNILSDPKERRTYDRRIRNPIRRDSSSARTSRTYNGPPSPNFAPFWEAANKLNNLVNEGAEFIKPKPFGKQELPLEKLAALAVQAIPHVKTLEDGQIPRKYWIAPAMNWLLFQWSQNRDLPYSLLYSMYDSYVDQNKSGIEKRKLNIQSNNFLTTLDKLLESQQVNNEGVSL